jgi:hypothetical protein
MLNPVTIAAELNVITARLVFLNSEIDENIRSLTGGDPGDACRALFHLDSAYEEADKARKFTHAKIEFISRSVIPEIFTASETKTLALTDVRKRFNVTTRISASIVDRDKGFGWLNEVGGGDLIQSQVNAQRLSSFVKEHIIERQTTPPEDAIKISSMQYTSMTGIK